jgi:thymidylate synthase
MAIYENLADALIKTSQQLLQSGSRVSGVTDPLSIGSTYGSAPRPYREILGHQFTVADPLAHLVARKSRPLNIPYLLANLIWTVSASNRLEDIAYWNSRASSFSDDATCIRSAPGPRIFSTHQQFLGAQDRLTGDPQTRRSMVIFIEPNDLLATTRDVPCMATLHFMLREGKLHAVATMRSQSALMVMPYDIALLTSLQCLMATQLNVPVGMYTHFSASFHCYDDELDLARDVASGGVYGLRSPMLSGLDDLRRIASFMRSLQFASASELSNFSVAIARERHPYMRDVMHVLLGSVFEKRGQLPTAIALWSNAGTLGELCKLSFPKSVADSS